MGRNSAIKHYDFRAPGENLSFFATSRSKASTVTQLLEAQWLTRASAIASESRGPGGKRYDEPVAVRLDKNRSGPLWFTWRRRRYPVDEALAFWVVDRYWWDEARRESRSYWRVRSGGGIYEICFDRIRKSWLLEAVLD